MGLLVFIILVRKSFEVTDCKSQPRNRQISSKQMAIVSASSPQSEQGKSFV